MTPALTPAGPADADSAHGLTRSNMVGYVERFWGAWDPAVYRADYARTETLVIRLGGEPDEPDRLVPDGDRLVADDLQVVPASRNRGVGTWALAQVEAAARARGLAAVRLRCFRGNPAARLDRRAGYAVADPGPDADRLEKPVTARRPGP